MDEYEALGLSPQPGQTSWEGMRPEESGSTNQNPPDEMRKPDNAQEKISPIGMDPLMEMKLQMEQTSMQAQPETVPFISNARGKKNYAEVRGEMKRDLQMIKRHYPQEQAAVLEKIPNLDTYLEYRIRGVPPPEAYHLANFERLSGHKTVKRSGEDKQHLFPAGGGPGRHMSEPPADVMDLYKRLNPGASREEIVKHWNKCRKGENT